MSNMEFRPVSNEELGSFSYLDKLLKKNVAAPDRWNWPEVLRDKVDSELEELDENLENRSKEYVKDKSFEIYAKRKIAALICLGFFTTDELKSLAGMYRPLDNCYEKFLEKKPELLDLFQNSIRECAQEELKKKDVI